MFSLRTIKQINQNKIFSQFLFSTTNKVSNIKKEIIKHSLLNVSKYGWSESNLKVSANEIGYSNVN